MITRYHPRRCAAATPRAQIAWLRAPRPRPGSFHRRPVCPVRDRPAGWSARAAAIGHAGGIPGPRHHRPAPSSAWPPA